MGSAFVSGPNRAFVDHQTRYQSLNLLGVIRHEFSIRSNR